MGRVAMIVLATLVVVGVSADTPALERKGFGLEVVVDGMTAREYRSPTATYVEALDGREYVLRLTNPLPVRVAVALAVDGLNTIDARRTTPQGARKWVLGPYETIEIAGWQVSATHARRFFFTREPDSYGAALGRTANLGVIEAVVFRERACCRGYDDAIEGGEQEARPGSPPAGDARRAPTPRAEPRSRSKAGERPDKAMSELSDDNAATGIGAHTAHRVRKVEMDLEPSPYAVLRIRYELASQLVALGMLPTARRALHRREHASGFDGDYCPEPDRP